MLKKEHVKQASVEKVAKFTHEIFTHIMQSIHESTGYLNDTEQVMCAVMLGDAISTACENVIGEEGVNLILEHFASEKEKLDNERKNDNKEKWGTGKVRF